MKLTELEEWALPIIAIALSFFIVKDKGAATILLVATSGVITYLLTKYWGTKK